MVSAQMPELRNFYKHLYEKGWNVSGYGDNKDERDLLERFHYVVDVFLDLKPGYGSTPIAFAFVFNPISAVFNSECITRQPHAAGISR
jgi:hypothetical protein